MHQSVSKRVTRAFLVWLALSISVSVYGQTFMVFNVQWFWDEETPHEGSVVQDFDDFPFSKRFVDLKAYAIANLIVRSGADVVGLVEVENENALDRIRDYLPDEWESVFKKGRDTFTGQDVALLTRLSVERDTITTFDEINGRYRGTTKRPSKVLGVGLESDGTTFFVINAHLLSKRRNSLSKDRKRAAQANAVFQAAEQHYGSYDHVVVMGDLNDVPGSAPLKELRGLNGSGDLKLVQTAPTDGSVISIKKYNEVIDHILLTESLAAACSSLQQVNSGPISDHNAMQVVCEP